MAKAAAIVVIGNEILSGKTKDENSGFLAQELRSLGVDVRRILVIPDQLDTIADEVRNASEAHDYVFTSGGVGPTHDDLTMHGIARAFHQKVKRNRDLELALRGYYPPQLVEPNLLMADVPENARLLSRPGMWFPVVVVHNVYIFPGVPEILQRKFANIREMFREDPYHLVEVFLRADEGQIALILHQVLEEYPELQLGSYPYFTKPEYSIKLTLESKDSMYLKAAHDFLLEELSRIGVYPIQLTQPVQ
jgi:molybdenum cofactor synthesis domain-containing protein